MAYFTINAPCATTTTTTTTVATYTVNLYGNWASTPASETATIYWDVNYSNVGSLYIGDSTVCDILTSISVSYGDVVSMYALGSYSTMYMNGSINTSYSGCPSNANNFCTYSETIYGNRWMAISIYTDTFGAPQWCA